MISFSNINFSAASDDGDGNQSRLLRGVVSSGLAPFSSPSGGPLSFDEEVHALAVADALALHSDEAASRLHLQTYLEDAGNEWMAAITAPHRGELVPDMRLVSTAVVPALTTNSVIFQQSAQAIPIFGGRIAVDIDPASKALIAINGKLVPAPTLSALATVSPQQALDALIAWCAPDPVVGEAARGAATAPILTWYLDEANGEWHLAHHFASVPLAPPPDPADAGPDRFPNLVQACVCTSPRTRNPLYDYFVDAHDGSVVFCFSSTQRLDIPVQMDGTDANMAPCTFFGMQGLGGGYILRDPLRNIETYDYGGNDLDAQPQPGIPALAIAAAGTSLGNSNPAAVSAHYHALKVFDFYNGVLKRKSVDDKGMKLISVINSYSGQGNNLPGRQWGNAVWWQGKMWYGQTGGISFARYLDIVAHELTHGVTASSSNLIYRAVQGALNESFSDFFGVVIANWYPGEPQAIAAWNWQIGAGLGQGGGSIRDFANPARTGQPDHWSQYQPLPLSHDQGGVHIYSGIHNKALYHLLSDTDANGVVFPTVEAVLLVYLTLTRLTPTSDFGDSRRTLEGVTRVYHAGNPTALADRLTRIANAFGTVGL